MCLRGVRWRSAALAHRRARRRNRAQPDQSGRRYFRAGPGELAEARFDLLCSLCRLHLRRRFLRPQDRLARPRQHAVEKPTRHVIQLMVDSGRHVCRSQTWSSILTDERSCDARLSCGSATLIITFPSQTEMPSLDCLSCRVGDFRAPRVRGVTAVGRAIEGTLVPPRRLVEGASIELDGRWASVAARSVWHRHDDLASRDWRVYCGSDSIPFMRTMRCRAVRGLTSLLFVVGVSRSVRVDPARWQQEGWTKTDSSKSRVSWQVS